MRDLISKNQKCAAPEDRHLMPSSEYRPTHDQARTHTYTPAVSGLIIQYINKKNLDDHITDVV